MISDARVPLIRPRFLKLSIVVFLLLMPFAVYSVCDYVEMRRPRLRIEAIAERGEPTTALAYRPLNGASTQAARYYQAAASLVFGYSAEIPAPIGHQLSAAAKSGVWPPELVNRARSIVEEHHEALSLVDRAAALPFDGFSPGTTFNYLTANLMGVSKLCALRASISALDGKADAAVASIYTDVKLARATRLLPSVPTLAFVLKLTHPSSGSLERLAAALAELDRADRFKQQAVWMRGRMLDQGFASDLIGTGFRLWNLHQTNHSLDVFARLIAAAESAPMGRHAAVMAVGEWPVRWNRNDTGRAALESVLRDSERQTDVIRCARRLVAGEVVDCPF